MITERKLRSLKSGTRIRKTARLLEQFERLLRTGQSYDSAYLGMLLGLAGEDLEIPVQTEFRDSELLVREVNRVRHAILAFVGKDPADWDLNPAEMVSDGAARRGTGIRVFLEDIRSPYNMGAIFRTAAAFDVDEIILSPDCASPDHPRAVRTSMNTVHYVPWRVAELTTVVDDSGNLFALETGGNPIGSFDFPHPGIVILGNEELGISPETRRIVSGSAGVCSIDLPGAKSSLNVSVAFGILVHWWHAGTSGPIAH